jgi:oxygen-independent coproporphyrinogen-3 oxidase
MAGIYIHIPFCKSRCIYCNFYSTTGLDHWQQRYVDAVCGELRQRKDYLHGAEVKTIYIGGGTPSQLSIDALKQIFDTIGSVYSLDACEEVTVEANPDDLKPSFLSALSHLPVNRLSMGIQTFDDGLLRLLNRRHDAAEAEQAVADSRAAGFQNISIDLIYGLPGETDGQWDADISRALALHPDHISAYCLSYEDGTALAKMKSEHRIEEVDEQRCLDFYTHLMDRLCAAGYEHYEISNFCLPGRHSRHNSSYWDGTPYLGCGAAAHSYDGTSREWNVADIRRYVEGMEAGERPFHSEQLTTDMRYDEMVMTALRTRRGIDIALLRQYFGDARLDYCLRMAAPHLANGKLENDGNFLRLTRKGIFVSDDIISDLFAVR